MSFGNIKEEHLVIGIFAIVLALVVYFLDSFSSSTPPQPVVDTGPYVDPCAMPVTTSCDVVVQRDFKNCKDSEQVKEAIDTLLANPEDSDVCKEKQLTLDSYCATGCMVDFSSMYQLAGDTRTDLITRTGEGCLVRGTRTVNMRANCITNPNYKEPEPEKPEGSEVESE